MSSVRIGIRPHSGPAQEPIGGNATVVKLLKSTAVDGARLTRNSAWPLASTAAVWGATLNTHARAVGGDDGAALDGQDERRKGNGAPGDGQLRVGAVERQVEIGAGSRHDGEAERHGIDDPGGGWRDDDGAGGLGGSPPKNAQ